MRQFVRATQASVLSLAAALPAVCQAAEPLLTPAGIFSDAAPFQKLIILGLLVSIIAALAVTVMKLIRGPALAGGSAFVAGLRLAGPLVGTLGASYGLMMGMIGTANVPYPVTLKVMAPGLAECLFVFCLGVLAGTVAVACHWIIEARLDRAVLKA